MKSISLFFLIIIVLSSMIFLVEKNLKAYSQMNYSMSEIQNALSSSWNGYKNYYISNGRVIRPDQGGDTVSEGQSYAMLRSVYMNDRSTFDSVWNWTKSNLSRQNNPNASERDNLFAWDYKGNVSDWASATDADEDIAISLVFASKKWDYKYMNDAKPIINDILAHDTIYGNDGKIYISGGSYGRYQANPDIDLSYLAPAYYKIFANITGDSRWNSAVETSYYVYQKSVSGSLNTNAGLFPNWVSFNKSNLDITANYNPNRGIDYTYDAFRAVYRIGQDALWFNSDSAKSILNGNIKTFFKGQFDKNNAIWAEYDHYGNPKNTYESSTIYGGDIAVFAATGDSYLTNIIASKIMKDYNYNNGNSYFGSTQNYYGNNWAWFGLLMAANETTNLYGTTSTPQVNNPGISTNNSLIQLESVNSSYSLKLSVDTTKVTSSNYLIDTEIKDKNNQKVGQVVINNLTQKSTNFEINSIWQIPQNFPSGTYNVSIGIFSNDWQSLYSWNNNMTQLKVN